jgi:hypothetical protein
LNLTWENWLDTRRFKDFPAISIRSDFDHCHRSSPLSLSRKPSDDGMSYDEWEAVRIVKCIAALKLMRRCPPLFLSESSKSANCQSRNHVGTDVTRSFGIIFALEAALPVVRDLSALPLMAVLESPV